MVVEVWPLPSMGGATSWRSQGRVSVIAVSSPGCEGSRLPLSSVPELVPHRALKPYAAYCIGFASS